MECLGKTISTSFSVRRLKICEANDKCLIRELLLLKYFVTYLAHSRFTKNQIMPNLYVLCIFIGGSTLVTAER
jgi:hypothetical protein